MTIPTFRRHILNWYRKNGRDLPWRATRDPYRILISEIMLQQTQVSRVLPKYHAFLKRFPAPAALAQAADRDVLAVWSGLGYWRRARYLKQAATAIAGEYNGRWPRTPHELQALPGVGPYTSGAVACFAFGCAEPFIDTNIRRVYLHFFFPKSRNVADTEILDIARKAVWRKDPRTWHWALFDYGALCLKRNPANRRSRHYAKQSPFEGSFRFFRTHVVRRLLASPRGAMHRDEILDFLDDLLRKHERDYSSRDILQALVHDGLVRNSGHRYFV